MEALRGSSRCSQDQPRGGGARGGALVFIGFMGAGKSTVAAEVAEALGLKALDSDEQIERRAGMSIAALFEQQGEARFRELEERVVLELLKDANGDVAISLGGGSVLSPRVQEALAAHTVALVDVDAMTAWSRARTDDVERPLAKDFESFAALAQQRAPTYAALADAILPGTVAGVGGQAAGALAALRHAPTGTRMLWASSASGSYPVLLGRGLVSEGLIAAGEVLGGWPLDRSCSRAFCVTDENVGRRYGDRLGDLLGSFTIAAGEAHKTIESAQEIWGALLAAGVTRADHVVALGGGVVGDLAGFCAATYQRGIAYVQVPTTLVAQVDSAYGGKTGVDLPHGKNYVGAYHQPSGVIVDPDVLSSLPRRELSAGWVEVVKTALIAGGELWERVREDAPIDEGVILGCAGAKLSIVAEDERDAGARQALNLGHTIGHAIETATGYERYLHGEAVGLGLLAALRLSGLDDLRERVGELMAARGLPRTLEGADVEDVLAASRRDKKRLGVEVPFVLLRAPGEVAIGQVLPEAEVRAAIAELQSESGGLEHSG